MGLVKKGRNWFIVYREDTRYIWRKTGLDDKIQAQAVHDVYMTKVKTERQKRIIDNLLNDTPIKPEKTPSARNKKRVPLSDTLRLAAKYRAITDDQTEAFGRFTKWLPANVVYCDQITADTAQSYLVSKYSDNKGKTWNNNRSALNTIFRLIMIDAGLPESPFERVQQRLLTDEEPQRAFTLDECKAIINAAKEPWKSACMIAFHTGLRQKDCFGLLWSDIENNVIHKLPGKTSRYRRRVRIPIHQQLRQWLDNIPRKGQRILGAYDNGKRNTAFREYFGKLLDSLKIYKNKHGRVIFNSFRNTYVTRCDQAGINRESTMSIVGHMAESQNREYSNYIAVEVLELPSISL